MLKRIIEGVVTTALATIAIAGGGWLTVKGWQRFGVEGVIIAAFAGVVIAGAGWLVWLRFGRWRK
jgi:hypothetical protein